jgi:radical SAM protein with 4Fe4S-binding SPASM domain
MDEPRVTASADIRRLNSVARERATPLTVAFELTHSCNLKCRHCYVVADPRPELTTPEVEEVLIQLAEAGALFVTFTGGEPLLREDLLHLVGVARELRFAVRLFTNATLIDDQIADAIADLDLLDVGVSLYGSDAETHDFVTGVAGSFSKTTRAVEALTSRSVRVHIKFTLTRHNNGQMDCVTDLATQVGATIQLNPELTPRNDGDRGPLELRLEHDDLARVLALDALQNGPRDLECQVTCSAGRDMLSVWPSGLVSPCLQMPLPIGDLRLDSFGDIWNSDKAREVRAFRLDLIEPCIACEDAAYCRPCVGLNLIENGRMDRPSLLNCVSARARREGVESWTVQSCPM